jgi:hypothetical protein
LQRIAQGFFTTGFFPALKSSYAVLETFLINFLVACLCYKLQTALSAMNSLPYFEDSGNVRKG